MDTKLRGLITTVAIGQFIPVLLYPPAALASANLVILAVAIAIFALVGFYLVQRRVWAKTLTIFIQGFNIITRLMILTAHGANPIKDGGGLNWDVIVFNLVAIGLSTLIMYRLDVPEIELAFNR